MNNTSRTRLSDDYILGLVDGEGCFSFSTSQTKIVYDKIIRTHVPSFCLRMHIRDFDLICAVRDYLGLKNTVYCFKACTKDGYSRGAQAAFVVRDFGALRDIVIPFFYKRLLDIRLFSLKLGFAKWRKTLPLEKDINYLPDFIDLATGMTKHRGVTNVKQVTRCFCVFPLARTPWRDKRQTSDEVEYFNKYLRGIFLTQKSKRGSP